MKELDQFAYVASHDLKAPLRAINTLAGLIRSDLGGTISQESQDNLTLLQNRIRRMEELLNALLQYSRVGKIKYEPEDIEVSELIEGIIELLVPPESMTISVKSDIKTIRSVRVTLELVLRNLIGNAIKHHHRADGSIEITLSKKRDKLVITVSDNGPGIDPKFHVKIFEMFQTLRPRDEVEGSGMGLAIVKKTVEVLGGEIAVESRVGEGSKFIVQFPIAMI